MHDLSCTFSVIKTGAELVKIGRVFPALSTDVCIDALKLELKVQRPAAERTQIAIDKINAGKTFGAYIFWSGHTDATGLACSGNKKPADPPKQSLNIHRLMITVIGS